MADTNYYYLNTKKPGRFECLVFNNVLQEGFLLNAHCTVLFQQKMAVPGADAWTIATEITLKPGADGRAVRSDRVIGATPNAMVINKAHLEQSTFKTLTVTLLGGSGYPLENTKKKKGAAKKGAAKKGSAKKKGK